MKPRQGFRQISWSIWSGVPNNPRGGEKKGSFFSKNLKFFFDFCEIQRGDPLDEKKSKKILKFFEKKFINKNFLYAQFIKVHQKSQKNLNVYGQLSPITPEAGKKRAPFLE